MSKVLYSENYKNILYLRVLTFLKNNKIEDSRLIVNENYNDFCSGIIIDFMLNYKNYIK